MKLHLPLAGDGKRHLPLAADTRAADTVRPLIAVWEITLRCDLSCAHCGSRAGRARDHELSTVEALDLVAQLADLGVLEVTLIGGEVYLRDDWTTIARAIGDAGMTCTITTGGRGFTVDHAMAAARAGVQNVSVSLDGPAEAHDALRGLHGSFAGALAALHNARAAGIPVTANTQINRRNWRDIPSLLPILVEHGAHAWQIMLTAAMGRAADEEALLLEPHQLLDVIPMLADLKPRARDAGVRLLPANNVGYFGPYESILRGDFPGGHRAPCGAGRSALGIESHGAVKGCPSLPSAAYTGGNVRDHRLREIWERAIPLRITRDFTADDLWGYCHDCYYADACRGGCNWTAHVLFGKRGNNPFCHHRALELLRQGRRERLVRRAPAPGAPYDHAQFDLVVEDWPESDLAGAREKFLGGPAA